MGEKSGVICYLQQSESNTLFKPFSYEDMNSELLDSEAYEPYARVFQSSVFVNSILFFFKYIPCSSTHEVLPKSVLMDLRQDGISKRFR